MLLPLKNNENKVIARLVGNIDGTQISSNSYTVLYKNNSTSKQRVLFGISFNNGDGNSTELHSGGSSSNVPISLIIAGNVVASVKYISYAATIRFNNRTSSSSSTVESPEYSMRKPFVTNNLNNAYEHYVLNEDFLELRPGDEIIVKFGLKTGTTSEPKIIYDLLIIEA